MEPVIPYHRTMTMKSLATAKTLRTPIQRPKVSFNVEVGDHQNEVMTLVKDADPLPIVELKPFVQKVWRREKSFASTWERSPSVATEKSEKSETGTVVSKSRDTDTVSTLALDTGPEEAPGSPPPRTSHSLPARLTERFLTVYVNAFEDFKSQKEHFNRFVGESSFKTKGRVHPMIDPKNKKQPEHSVNIIPGFITRDDRTKTTLHEISEGESSSRFYSCSPKAIGPEEIRKQQQIRISGEPFYRVSRPSPQESSPAPSRITNSSWHGASIRHGSPASMLYHSKRDRKAKRTKTPLYDHLDRMGALPSLSINATGLRQKTWKKQDDVHSDDYVDYSDKFDIEFRPNVGGIENSLVVLSKHGAPTKVERQISFELEKNLSRFRKLKDYSPFEINPSELAKYYPSPSLNMTQGEAQIRQAMESNTSNRHKRKLHTNRNIHRKLLGNKTLNGMQNSQFAHGILKKSFNEIDHIDSFDHLYGPYNNISDATYTPNEEPNAPFDTPRSHTHTESRISSKAVELEGSKQNDILKSKEADLGEIKLVSGIETQTPRTHIPIQVMEKKLKVENSIEETDSKFDKADHVHISASSDIGITQMKTSQPRPTQTQIDASGRTFLTSDNVPQVGMVTS